MRRPLAVFIVIIQKLKLANQPGLGVLIIIRQPLIPHQARGQCFLLLRSLVVPLALVKLKLVLPAAGAPTLILILLARQMFVLVLAANI